MLTHGAHGAVSYNRNGAARLPLQMQHLSLFTQEVGAALLGGRHDLIVHSLYLDDVPVRIIVGHVIVTDRRRHYLELGRSLVRQLIRGTVSAASSRLAAPLEGREG